MQKVVFSGEYPLSCELTAFIESYVRKCPFHTRVAFFVGREQRKWASFLIDMINLSYGET